MQFYMEGYQINSKTGGIVLVKISAIDGLTVTDLVLPGRTYIRNPFYIKHPLNCGQIAAITDLNEKETFEECTIIGPGGQLCVIRHGQYFNTEPDAPLVTYRCKAAAIEEVSYAHNSFTGASYRHHEGGNIKVKSHYLRGVLHSEKFYRDDAFNTLERCVVYYMGDNQNGGAWQGDKVLEFFYDEREALVSSQVWARNADGTVFNTEQSGIKEIISDYSTVDRTVPADGGDESERSEDEQADLSDDSHEGGAPEPPEGGGVQRKYVEHVERATVC